jgi:hypothetical protein
LVGEVLLVTGVIQEGVELRGGIRGDLRAVSQENREMDRGGDDIL